MRGPTSALILVAVAASAAALCGCSPRAEDTAPSGPAPSTGPVTELPTEDDAPGTGEVSIAEYPVDSAADGMHDENVARIEDHAVIDQRTIRIAGMTGTTRCFGVRPVVQETDTEVRLALVAGTLPGTDGPCTLEARLAAVDAPLARDLGDRTIVLLDELDPGELTRNP